VEHSQGTLASSLRLGCSDKKSAACFLLLVKSACSDFSPVAGRSSNNADDSSDGWWDKWKDHLFYVVAPGFAPADTPAADCAITPEECLQINGHAYAAAVIFAGAPLAGQTRQGANAKMQITNYLEGENAVTVQMGGKKLERAGNDRIACIAYSKTATPKFSLAPDCG
jgi:hypothetical protein